MPKKIKSLTEVIDREEAFHNFRKSVKENNVVNEFNNIFPELTKTVFAVSAQKGILLLNIENSVMRNEIYLQKKLMIEKINNHFNQQIIVDVKFTNFRNSDRKS